MLERVPVLEKHVDDYAGIVGIDVIDRIRALAAPLQGARVLHVNATAYGGGVAELLATHVPLLRSVGHRRRLAGDARQRRVLRGHQGSPQRVAGRRHRVDPADATHVPREGARQRAAARRPLRLRRDPRSAARGDARASCASGSAARWPTRSGSGVATSTSPTPTRRCGSSSGRSSSCTTRRCGPCPSSFPRRSTWIVSCTRHRASTRSR